MDEKFRKLIELGAGEFEHVNGSLIAHLEGTRCLLKAWLASQELQDAALYHAAYATSAYTQNLVVVERRQDVVDTIGVEAEAIVYDYCMCDRDKFHPQFGQTTNPLFFHRLSGERSELSQVRLKQLCELTVANEVEIALQDPNFVRQHRSGLFDLFSRMSAYLSIGAQRKVQQVFGTPH
jgi:hypothetical protein